MTDNTIWERLGLREDSTIEECVEKLWLRTSIKTNERRLAEDILRALESRAKQQGREEACGKMAYLAEVLAEASKDGWTEANKQLRERSWNVAVDHHLLRLLQDIDAVHAILSGE